MPNQFLIIRLKPEWRYLTLAVDLSAHNYASATTIGENGYITWNDYDIGDVDNDPAHLLWVGNDGTLDYVTTVFSHELAEVVTDPTGSGVRQVGCSGGSCQIGRGLNASAG